MRLSGHQPVYLPGTILFSKISLSDAFMFVGHCQYTPKSWHSHNYIKGMTTPLSVPVHKGSSINTTYICGDHWKKKHLKSIALAYLNYPFFNDYFFELEALLSRPYDRLGYMNADLIQLILSWLDIEIPIHYSDGVEGHKTDMLISMCEKVGADEYLSSPGETYVDRQLMAAAGIKHHYLKFEDPDYGQKRLVIKGVEQPLSVLDLIFSEGPSAAGIIREAGHVLD